MSFKHLVVVGHGWPELPLADNPVVSVAESLALRQTGFESVSAAFLKQDPVLSPLQADHLVVPFFMSDGYFTDRVRKAAGDARVSAPIGSSSELNDVVDALVSQLNEPLVIVGHGTQRNPRSAETVWGNVRRLNAQGMDVHAAFIDQEPGLDMVMAQIQGPVTVLPFFVAPGPHTLVDVPNMAASGRPGLDGVTFLAPLGASDGMADLILSLALAI